MEEIQSEALLDSQRNPWTNSCRISWDQQFLGIGLGIGLDIPNPSVIPVFSELDPSQEMFFGVVGTLQLQAKSWVSIPESVRCR